MIRFIRITHIALALFAGALIGLASTAVTTAQNLTTVKFGSVGGATDAGIYIADEYGYFKEAGIAVETQRIANAPSLTTAIATNQLDVAGIAVTPGLFASLKQGLNLRIVGDKNSIRPGFSATRLAVRPELAKDNESATIRGLKGKKVAVSSRASVPYILLVRLLHKEGMTEKDVEVVELSYPNMVSAMQTGAIDSAILLEPFLSRTIQAKAAVMVSDLYDVMPNAVAVPLVYSEGFASNKKIAIDFMTAYVRGVRIYNEAFTKNKDKDRVIEIVARRAGVDQAVVRDGYPVGLDPDQNIDLASLEAFQQFYFEQKQLREKVDVKKITDPSFSAAAIAKLGKYE